MADSRRERLRAAQEAAEQRSRRIRLFAVIGVVVGALLALTIVGVKGLGGSSETTAGRPVNATEANDGIVANPGKAKPGAPVVNLYADYLCQHCIVFDEKFGLPLSGMADDGEIQLVMNTKVFLDKGNTEGLSHKAAMAAACSDDQGVYYAYHQGIYAAAYNGPYTDALLRNELPVRVGLSGDKLAAFQSCYDSKAMFDWVNGVEAASVTAGVADTPTLKVNGRTIDLKTLPADGAKIRQFVLDAAKG